MAKDSYTRCRHSSKLETLRREVRGGEWGPRHRAGLVLPEREAPRERGAGLNLTTYKKSTKSIEVE